MPKRLTTEIFIKRAIDKLDKRYDYSQVRYKHSQMPVTIVCPAHGPFQQTPTNHLRGAGCPKCGSKSSGKSRRHSKEKFISKALIIHGNRFDYSEVEYKGIHTHVTIICPEHGPFKQSPANHLSGKICPQCGSKSSGKKRRSEIKGIITAFREIHKDKYDYSEVEYKGIHTHVTIICPEHGPFKQSPANHLSGKICPSCASHGFNPSESAVLYYLAIKTDKGTTLYKLGVTNNTIKERFTTYDLARIRVIKTWPFPKGQDAIDREKELITLHGDSKYNGPDVLNSGNTELFIKDILGLDELRE